MTLSGWCSGPAGDQCHVNPCRSRSCECPRRQHHIHAKPETPRDRGESQDKSTRDQGPRVVAPAGRYTAVERDDGLWEVIGPDGLPAQISGSTTWTSEEAALTAERNGNRRKHVRGAA